MKGKIGIIIAIMLISTAFFGMLSPAVSAGGISEESMATDTIHVPGDYLTIQDAIDFGVLSTDDPSYIGQTYEIIVDLGTYPERLHVDELKAPITLTASDPDPAKTIIDGGGGDVVTVKSKEFEITGFTIQNGGYGIVTPTPYTNRLTYTITNNVFSNSGIYLYYVETVVCNGNTLNGAGIYIVGMVSITVSGNILVGGGISVQCWYSGLPAVKIGGDTSAEGNQVTGGPISVKKATGAIIKWNNIDASTGIILDECTNALLEENHMENSCWGNPIQINPNYVNNNDWTYYIHDIKSTNTVKNSIGNSISVCYIYGETSPAILPGSPWYCLVDCDNIDFNTNIIGYRATGLTAIACTDLRVGGATFEDLGTAIKIWHCMNVEVTDCDFIDCNTGIYMNDAGLIKVAGQENIIGGDTLAERNNFWYEDATYPCLYGITLQTSNYDVIKNNNFQDYCLSIIFWYNVYNTIVEDNIIYGAPKSITYGSNGIFLRALSDNNHILNNEIHDCSYEGINVGAETGGWSFCDNNEIINNKIYNCPTGIYHQAGNGNTYYGNEIYGGETPFGFFHGSDNHIGVDGELPNIIDGQGTATLGAYFWNGPTGWLPASYPATNNYIVNNVITNCQSGLLISNLESATISNNVLTNVFYNFMLTGEEAADFVHTINDDNWIDGVKRIKYINGDVGSTITPSDPAYSDAGSFILYNCDGTTIEGFDSNIVESVTLAFTNGVNVLNNDLAPSFWGFYLYNAIGSTIQRNTQSSTTYGLWIEKSSGNLITENTFNYIGPGIWSSGYGAYIIESGNNEFYHNNFIDYPQWVYTWDSTGPDFWNSQIAPFEGNYWHSATSGADVTYFDTDVPKDFIGDNGQVPFPSTGYDGYPLMIQYLPGLPDFVVDLDATTYSDNGIQLDLSVGMKNEGSADAPAGFKQVVISNQASPLNIIGIGFTNDAINMGQTVQINLFPMPSPGIGIHQRWLCVDYPPVWNEMNENNNVEMVELHIGNDPSITSEDIIFEHGGTDIEIGDAKVATNDFIDIKAIVRNLGTEGADVRVEFSDNLGTPIFTWTGFIAEFSDITVEAVNWQVYSTADIYDIRVDVTVIPPSDPSREADAGLINNHAEKQLLVGPDLTVEILRYVVTGVNPKNIAITYKLINNGAETATSSFFLGTPIAFYDEDPETVGTLIKAVFYDISILPFSESSELTDTITLPLGTYKIYALVDPIAGNFVDEYDDTNFNNKDYIEMIAGEDYIVDISEATISETFVPIGTVITVDNIIIQNFGGQSGTIDVSFYESPGGILIGTQSIYVPSAHVNDGKSAPFSLLNWIPTAPSGTLGGFHNLRVVVNEGHESEELDGTNNEATFTDTVFAGIQGAINHAANGAWIRVPMNIYNENLIVNKPIHLAPDDYRTRPIIDGSGSTAPVITIDDLDGNSLTRLVDVSINEFIIKRNNNGDCIKAASTDNLQIYRNQILNTNPRQGDGINLFDTELSIIEYNILSGFDRGLYTNLCIDDRVRYNTFSDCNTGAKADDSSLISCLNWNTFRNCGTGFDYDPVVDVEPYEVNGNSFESCIIGIIAEDASDLIITGNLITNNDIGIYCKSGEPLIDENLIFDNDIGIYIELGLNSEVIVGENNTYSGNIYDISRDEPDIAPLAFASPYYQTICTYENAFFDASSSRDPNDDIIEYLWDFGDGNIGYGMQATHQYEVVGEYIVNLSVTDDDGNVATDTVTVVVLNSPPTAVIDVYRLVDITLTMAGVRGNTVTMYVIENGEVIDSVSVTRDIRNPHEQAQTLSLARYDGRNYQLLLEYSAEHKGVNPVNITITSETDSIMQYFTFNTKYGYEQTLTSDIDDELDEVLEFTQTYFFDASQSFDMDGEIVSYDWDFDDSSTATGELVNHAFVPGQYIVTLTTTDDDGATSTATYDLEVLSAPA